LENVGRCVGRTRERSCEVYHVINNDTSTSFTDLLGWMKKICKEPFDIVEPQKWLEKLEKLEHHPAKALIGVWRRAYGDDRGESPQQIANFDTKNAEKASQTMANVHLVDEKLLGKIWKWLEGEVSQKS
jgi:hypothetical protein